jgi:glycosyltransferase involved in cell wall biosynthesis
MKAKLSYLCSSESWGGLEMNHLRNAFWMEKLGHDVVIICLKNTAVEKTAHEFQLPVLTIPKHKKYYDFKNGRNLVTIISEQNISHLLIRSTHDMSILAYTKNRLGAKLHTSYFMEMQLGVKKTNILHTLRFKYIDLWSCPLNWLKVQVETLTNFKNELVVIPSGLELSQFQNMPSKENSRSVLNLPPEKLTFGLIGRFDAQKGQLLLLKAMQKCRNKEFVVVLLGEPTLHEGDKYYNDMTAMIQSEQLEQRVFIRPFRKDTSVFYNSIDWLIMATKSESIGMVTIEALACGTPVLGSNAGGTTEILKNGKGGLLFEPLNETDLAAKIDQICDGTITRDREELVTMANNYTHEVVCKMVEHALGLPRN